jgi:anti-sigma regulatory factor (Ser/Thr protein kinase)
VEKLDSRTFDDLLEDQYPFEDSDPSLDLCGIRLITPSALVQLASLCHALARQGHKLVISVDDRLVRSYLDRAGFVSCIEEVAEIESPLDAGLGEYLRGSNPMLIEVTKLESGAALPELLDQMVWVLRRRMGYRKFDAFDIATAVSEIAQNTFDHNEATYGFVAMQVYGRDPNRFLEIGVADFGVGLGETLRRNPKNAHIVSDADAIKYAIELGTSEHDDPTRGTGLYHLLEITYKHQGSVQIRSGDAKHRYRMDKKQGWAFTVPHVPGVQIAMNLPSKVSLDS